MTALANMVETVVVRNSKRIKETRVSLIFIAIYKYIFICCWFFLGSCKSQELNDFKAPNFKIITYNNTVPEGKELYEMHNSLIMNGIDSLNRQKKTITIDTNDSSKSGLLDFALNVTFKKKEIKNNAYYFYQVEAKPYSRALFKDTSYTVFGFSTRKLELLDTSPIDKREMKRKFNKYFFSAGFAGLLIPWEKYEKGNSVKENFISFSTNKIEFKKGYFNKQQKEYLKRVVNNGFVEYASSNNISIHNNDSKDRNNFYVNYYNNKRKILNRKSDYVMDFYFGLSERKDSILIDLKCYSQKNKDVNLLIPSRLNTHYAFKRSDFELGNHIDLNLAIRSIINLYIANNKFINYEKDE